MGCSYCFEKDVPIYQDRNLLTQEAADSALEWFFKHQEGPRAHIQLYGGEPLLNWQILVRIVEPADEWVLREGKELTKYLITNGTLLNQKRAEFLRDHDVSVQVNVDGDQKTHDTFRVLKNGDPTMHRIQPKNVSLYAMTGSTLGIFNSLGQFDPANSISTACVKTSIVARTLSMWGSFLEDFV